MCQITVVHVCVEARLGDGNVSRVVEAKALEDRGGAMTVIPRSIARELGLGVTGGSRVEAGAGVI